MARKRGKLAMHEGIETIASDHSVDEVVARLQSLMDARGIRLFSMIDHAGEAHAVGLAMRPTKLLIFGDPASGTPLMVSAPTTALDLPLKILVTEAESGKTLIFWNDPMWIEQRHGFDADFTPRLAVARALAEAAAQ
jgi:uncharacterized protein (DUF302 family)